MSLWYGWGEPGDALTLPPRVAELLTAFLGVSGDAVKDPDLSGVRVAPSTLPAAVFDGLAAAVGPGHVHTDDETRIRHAAGKSTVDLLRLRALDAAGAPDAVVFPGSHDEVLAVLSLCSEQGVAVVPFGGGTSVVGGLGPGDAAVEPRSPAAPLRSADGLTGRICLDVARLNRLLSIDPVSRVAVLEAGLRGPAAEALLAEHGMSLGHYPQSYEYGTIGGFAATRSSGQFSAGYGRFDEMVMALRVATPVGTIETGRAPRSAAGPDLRQLFLGAEGTLGVITAVSVRVHPLPVTTDVAAWSVPSFVDSFDLVRRLVQDGPVPTMVRLSDETETAVGSSGAQGCLLLCAYDSTMDRALVGPAEATPLPAEVGQDWQHSRYQAPYLRDALLRTGALAETLETATFWSGLPVLYEAVRAALTTALTDQGTPPVVLCHISHVYPTGASLYFTVVCNQSEDPIAQWQAAKTAASQAILDHGGTITHHHGVGTDHAAAYATEVGPLALAALRAVKRELDPHHILNPGVLGL
jgi:alkyldihydroxyacetonephosphate synthase